MKHAKLIRFQLPSWYCSQRHIMASIKLMHSHPLNTIASLSIRKSQTYSCMGIKPGLKRRTNSWPLTVALGSSNQLKLNHCNIQGLELTQIGTHLLLLGVTPILRSHYFSTINQLKHRHYSCNMEKIALRHGLEPNTALGFASCCISLSSTPLCYFFHIALAAVL